MKKWLTLPLFLTARSHKVIKQCRVVCAAICEPSWGGLCLGMCWHCEGDSACPHFCLTGDVKLHGGDGEKQCQGDSSHNNPFSTRGISHQMYGSIAMHSCCLCYYLISSWNEPLNEPFTSDRCCAGVGSLMICCCLFTGDPRSKSPAQQRGRQLWEPLQWNRLFFSWLLYCNLHVFITALLASFVLMIVPTMGWIKDEL